TVVSCPKYGVPSKGFSELAKLDDVTVVCPLTPAWRNRIQMPRDSKGQTTVTSSSFASSLKPLLGTPYFGQLTTVNQVKILDSFWQGIRKVMPAVFDEPGRYALQKSVGTFVMHGFLVSVLEYIRSKGGSV